MEMDKIRALAALMGEMGLEELSLAEGEEHLSLKKPQTAGVGAPPQVAAPPAAQPEPTEPVEKEEPGTVTVTSPMVGVFYAAPSPDEPPFVNLGQRVEAGDVLCVIEAMKLMNEIVAEQSGVITNRYPGNGQLVEFGQTLFRLRCDDE